MLALLLCPPAGALAQSTQDPADRLLREQQDRERIERLQQRTPDIGRPVEAAVDRDAAPESVVDPEPTFLIGTISVTGNTVLPQTQVDVILQPFVGKYLGINRINLLLRRLTQAFIDAGYITTRAYVGSQNLASGSLEITVIPGRIEKLRYNGRTLDKGQWNDPGVRLALPFHEADLLRLADLEQGIDQLNRLRRNRAEMKILPGETPGGSIVEIDNPQADRFYYSIGADNQGGGATGANRTRAGIEANDLLGLQESLSLAFVGSLDTNALLASASLPWGYNTLSYAYSYSEFQTLIGDSALLFGTSRGHSFAFNRVVARSRAGKSAIDASLSLREARRDINNVELTPQRLAVLRLAYNQLRRFELGTVPGYCSADIAVSRGLRAFSANHDPADLPREAARAQFSKLDVSAMLALQPTAALAYRGSIAGQWTREPLFSSEQIFIGGANTVRGFAEFARAGDRGFFSRHELAYSKLPLLFGERLRIEPFVFADAGRVQLIADRRWETLAGAGLGVRLSTRSASAEIALAQPLRSPDTLTDDKFRIHAAINLTF
jgi:hemolysin activation/secretion protein